MKTFNPFFVGFDSGVRLTDTTALKLCILQINSKEILDAICNGKGYLKCKGRREHEAQLSEQAESIVGNSTFASHVVWSSKTTLLLTSCYGSQGYSGFLVSSTRKKLAKREKGLVMKKIKDLGFDPVSIVDISTYCGFRK